MSALALGWVFGAVAAAAGAIQVAMLGRGARPRANALVAPLSFLARFVLVAVVLLAAARTGHLAGATIGWLAGFASMGAFVYRRLPRRGSPPSRRTLVEARSPASGAATGATSP